MSWNQPEILLTPSLLSLSLPPLESHDSPAKYKSKPIWVKQSKFFSEILRVIGNLTKIDEVDKHQSEEFSILGFGVSVFLDGEHPRDDWLDGGFALSKKLNRLSHRVCRNLRSRLHNSFSLSLSPNSETAILSLRHSNFIRFINIALPIFIFSQFRP